VAIFGRVLESEVEVGGAAAVLVSEKEIKSLLAETGGRLTAEESLQLTRTILSVRGCGAATAVSIGGGAGASTNSKAAVVDANSAVDTDKTTVSGGVLFWDSSCRCSILFSSVNSSAFFSALASARCHSYATMRSRSWRASLRACAANCKEFALVSCDFSRLLCSMLVSCAVIAPK